MFKDSDDGKTRNIPFRLGVAFCIETLRERKDWLISKQTHDDSQRAFELINMIDEINARLSSEDLK